ncbi:hypothetical protein ILYODFUR_033660 [Ilyodon furcidens]|uniref:Uncharacterized protein n=1 Tax=Ilyodon furcidens TaxID=33524 RepID=A0ABV0UBD7_9TELE
MHLLCRGRLKLLVASLTAVVLLTWLYLLAGNLESESDAAGNSSGYSVRSNNPQHSQCLHYGSGLWVGYLEELILFLCSSAQFKLISDFKHMENFLFGSIFHLDVQQSHNGGSGEPQSALLSTTQQPAC